MGDEGEKAPSQMTQEIQRCQTKEGQIGKVSYFHEGIMNYPKFLS
jgi:hypothetical protein